MSDLKTEIEQALQKDTDLSEEEYLKKFENSDASAKYHGAQGETPVTEAQRHSRIQSNFYGLCINYLAALLGEMTETNRLLQELLKNGK